MMYAVKYLQEDIFIEITDLNIPTHPIFQNLCDLEWDRAGIKW